MRLSARILLRCLAGALSAWLGAAVAGPHIDVSGAWVRATVPGQPATAAYLRIRSDAPLRLVQVSSPAAGRCEIHETTQQGDVMRMRMLSEVRVEPDVPVDFEERHRHLMLTGLARPLQAGDHVELTLTFVDARQARQTVRVDARVRGAD